MTATLAELENRIDALERELRGEKGLTDQRRALTTMVTHLDETRERMSKVETRLEGLSQALAVLTAGQAEMRGALNARIDAVQADIANLRRDMPAIVADAMREVLRNNRG
jgi:chromosome segregation ATPase